MMSSLFYVILIFCSCLLHVQFSTESHIPSYENYSSSSLFVFGDSLFDAGNNNYLQNAAKANFMPYGKTYFKYPTGRFSDGRIIPDFIAEYLKIPLIKPYLEPGNQEFTNGVNFASGGAGALVQTYPGMVIDLSTQLKYFKNVEKQLKKKIGKTGTKALLSKSISIFSVGLNDYTGAYLTNSTLIHDYTNKQFVGMVIGNLTTVIKELYKTGGRKFGVLNLSDLGYLPSVRALEQTNSNTAIYIIKQVLNLVKLHNKALSKVLKELKIELKGFEYSILDSYGSTTERIDNPFKYGFKEAKEACCGEGLYRGRGACGTNNYELCENPGEYLFFDGGHPTEKFHSLLADLMWSGDRRVTSPFNLRALIEGHEDN